jgi:hypothetical protein
VGALGGSFCNTLSNILGNTLSNILGNTFSNTPSNTGESGFMLSLPAAKTGAIIAIFWPPAQQTGYFFHWQGRTGHR